VSEISNIDISPTIFSLFTTYPPTYISDYTSTYDSLYSSNIDSQFDQDWLDELSILEKLTSEESGQISFIPYEFEGDEVLDYDPRRDPYYEEDENSNSD
jgi:hypothetical protein